ncbi:MAG: hypothetical protein WA322_13865 [Pseudolabrys sp.]
MMATAMHDPKPLRRLSFFDKKVGILAGSPPIRDTQPLHGGKKIAGLTVDNPVNKRAVDSSASGGHRRIDPDTLRNRLAERYRREASDTQVRGKQCVRLRVSKRI